MTIASEIDAILDPILAQFEDTLQFGVNGSIADIYYSGTAEMTTWGKTKAGIPIAYEGPPAQNAIDFARTRGAKLVTEMSDTTKKRLAQVVSDGIKNKSGIPNLSRSIRTEFADMTKYRSQLIARTETANALSTASVDTMKDMGIEGKRWVTVGDADVSKDICEPNGAQGIIPVGELFQSGHDAPPGHPNCRCAIAPARLPR